MSGQISIDLAKLSAAFREVRANQEKYENTDLITAALRIALGDDSFVPSRELRQQAKLWLHGENYGMGAVSFLSKLRQTNPH